MLSGLLKPRPPVDEATISWLSDTFHWISSHLGLEMHPGTPLVLPTNDYFPGRVNSVHGMAELVFTKVVEYAGMNDQGLRLAAPGAMAVSFSALSNGQTLTMRDDRVIDYDPTLVNSPGALVASFALALARRLADESREPPPGGAENLPFATEVAAVAMGYGVMVANSARTVLVRSCGGCGSSSASREKFLPPEDITYALAIFCHRTKRDAKNVSPHLDKPLRPLFRRALKDAASRG